jgi:hypothetical protein
MVFSASPLIAIPVCVANYYSTPKSIPLSFDVFGFAGREQARGACDFRLLDDGAAENGGTSMGGIKWTGCRINR